LKLVAISNVKTASVGGDPKSSCQQGCVGLQAGNRTGARIHPAESGQTSVHVSIGNDHGPAGVIRNDAERDATDLHPPELDSLIQIHKHKRLVRLTQ
jgi:hypothetical protein